MNENNAFTLFSECNTPPVAKDIKDTTISGEPAHNSWLHFSGNSEQFLSGMWDSTAGVFSASMEGQIEFCHILEGEAQIAQEDGTIKTVRAGDAFVMNEGQTFIWTVENYVKKHFVICRT